jgi:hypothetical protein
MAVSPKPTYGPPGSAWLNFRFARNSPAKYETFSGLASDSTRLAVPFPCRRPATSIAA